MKSLTLGLIALALVAFSPASFAGDDVIGTVLEVEGNATISSNGNIPVGVAVNTPVHPNDVILTGPASRVYVQLIDDTEFTLGENGQMTVDDYEFDQADKDDNHAVYSVVRGAFLYVSGLIAKKENPDVKVNVPVGSIGIRGTKFWGGNVGSGYDVIVGEGEVELATAGGKVRIGKGQGTTVKAGAAAPETPKAWPKARIDKAVATIALKNPAVIGERMKANAVHNEQLRAQHHEKIIQRKIFEREQERLNNGTKTDSQSDDAGAARRKRLREERERRLNSSTDPLPGTTDAATEKLRSVTRSDKPAGITVEPTVSTVRDTANGASSPVVEMTTRTVTTTVEKAAETVEKPVNPTRAAVKETSEKTTGAVKNTVRETGSATGRVLNNTLKRE